jgi:CBS domain-containing protein
VPAVEDRTSLRDALSVMLTSGGNSVVVRDADGQVKGLLTLPVLSRLLSQDGAEPQP